MHFASLILEGAHLKSRRQQIFIKKLKNKIFHFFFKIIQYPFNGFFQIKFCVRVPLNNTKTIFTREKKNGKTDFYIFVIKWYNIPLMHLASLTLDTGVASHTKPGHLIELKYVPILKIYRALDKNDSFLIV